MQSDILKSERYVVERVAVFDLDGVLVQNPADSFERGTIQDPDYWHNHWNDPDGSVPYDQIVELHDSLIESGWATVVLTARPDSYWRQTVAYLDKHFCGTSFIPPYRPDEQYLIAGQMKLVMRPALHGISVSGEWKREMLESWLKSDINLKFMVEDYKPNVEAVRDLLPCLLFERQK